MESPSRAVRLHSYGCLHGIIPGEITLTDKPEQMFPKNARRAISRTQRAYPLLIA
jgi:hypothetical protein